MKSKSIYDPRIAILRGQIYACFRSDFRFFASYMLPDEDFEGKKEEGRKFCPSISLVSLEEMVTPAGLEPAAL